MNIVTKFDIGQEVFFMTDNFARKAVIKGIRILLEGQNAPVIMYVPDGWPVIEEASIFSSLSDLFVNLMAYADISILNEVTEKVNASVAALENSQGEVM
jgi:hypothetical protein